jgi:hypothetical protein
MPLVSLILFFVYSYGLGFTATGWLKNSEHFLERSVMRLGIGLGVFAIVGVILSLFHVPIDWRILLVLSVAFPCYWLVRNRSRIRPDFKLRLTKSNINDSVAVLLSLILLWVFVNGAFAYPWLEDDDSWQHAQGIKYVQVEKSIREPIKGSDFLMYLDPYPPAYDMLMGVLKQTDSSLNWTLKFFNCLIIALGLLFFYFFAKEFMQDKNKALFATFVLFAIPCYLSHFIWAHSLAMALFFPTMYCFERTKYDKKWMFAAGAVVGGMLVCQPTTPIKFMVMFGIYWLVKSLSMKKIDYTVIVSVCIGGLLSLSWWLVSAAGLFGYASTFNLVKQGQINATHGRSLVQVIQDTFPPNSGSATRAYSFSEIINAKAQNMINNPIGIGIVLSFVVLMGLIYIIIKYKTLLDEKQSWMLVALLWAIFTFFGFNTVTFHLPIGFYGFRFWSIFAFSAALIAPLGMTLLYSIGKSVRLDRSIILIAFVVGILITSAYPKYQVNTSIWMSPGIDPMDGMQGKGYVWIETLPADSRVFELSSFAARVYGFDMYSCEWCEPVVELRKSLVNMSPAEFKETLKGNGYQYAVASVDFYQQYGVDTAQKFVASLVGSALFNPIHQTNSVIVMAIE